MDDERHNQASLLFFVTCLLLLAIASIIAYGDEPQRIRTTTRLVQINVVVQNKEGQPVSDLTRDDFSLQDGGKPQEIAVFSIESARPFTGPVPALPSNTFTNRVEHREGTQTSVTVILLDGLNTEFRDQAHAKRQIVKFLEQIHPDDHVALYVLGDGLRVLHDFTSDARPLLRALAKYKGHISPEFAAESLEGVVSASMLDEEIRVGQELDALMERSVPSTIQTMKDFYTSRRVELTLRGLEAVANHVARFPGRKNLLWVSSAFPLSLGDDALDVNAWRGGRETRSFWYEIEMATRAINNANLAVYPIDARGLVGIPALDASRPTVEGLDPITKTVDATMWYDQLALTIGTMKTIAARTGGRAFFNSNDIFGGIRQAVDDSRVTYVLGYYPNHNRWDGRFREVNIRAKRPGLRVRHRAGYFALPEEELAEEQRRSRLDEVVWSPIEATSIGLVATVQREGTLDVPSLTLHIKLDPHDITMRQQGGNRVGGLDFLIVQPDAAGGKLSGEFGKLDLNLENERYEEIQKRGLILDQRVRIVPGAHELRVVVRDRTSGAVGSVNLPLSQFLTR